MLLIFLLLLFAFLVFTHFPKMSPRESFLQPFLLLFRGRWINRLRLWLVLVFIHRSLKISRLGVWIKPHERCSRDLWSVDYDSQFYFRPYGDNNNNVCLVWGRAKAFSVECSCAGEPSSQTLWSVPIAMPTRTLQHCASSYGEIFHRFSTSASGNRSRFWSINRNSSYVHLNAIWCQNEISISVVATFAVINIEIFRTASTTGPISVSRWLSSSSGWVAKHFANFLPLEQPKCFIHNARGCLRLSNSKTEQSETFRLFSFSLVEIKAVLNL